MSQPGGLSSNSTGTSMLLKIACGLKHDRKKQYQEQKWFGAWAMIARAASPSFSARTRKSRNFTVM